MRRSVLLAVWLGLLLSLLKESGSQTTLKPTESSTLSPKESGSQTEKPSESTTTTKPSESTTTTKPSESTTTTKPSESTTTTKPSESTTTTKPSESTTTTKPSESTTTTKPSESTTSSSTESGSQTTTKPSESTSTKPAESTTTKPSESTTSSSTVDFCHDDPCGRNLATCISLNSTYTCECQYGFYYNDSNKNCDGGQVFPATVEVKASYSISLQAVNSKEYQDLFKNLSDFFEKAFKEKNTYRETVIVEIKPSSESRNAPLLNVIVTNLFTWDTTEDEDTVKIAVKAEIKKTNQAFVSVYNEAKPCDAYQCDTKTTVCQGDKFPECICKPEFEKTDWDVRSCSACNKTCSAAANKLCVKEEEGPKCKCMINFETKGENCVACSVGYSGEECSDNSELILIIVGTVLGAVILSLVIAIIIISVRAKHKQNPEKRSLIKPEYSDTNTSDNRPSMFPRVQTTSGHANPGYQPNNPYEMRSTNRDRFPQRDFDDLYEASREPRGFRSQNRY